MFHSMGFATYFDLRPALEFLVDVAVGEPLTVCCLIFEIECLAFLSHDYPLTS
jgi:hypothetical protein